VTNHPRTPEAREGRDPALTQAEALALETELVAAFARAHQELTPARALFERASDDQGGVRRLVELACEAGGYQSLQTDELAASGRFVLDALETAQLLISHEGGSLECRDWARLRQQVGALERLVDEVGRWRATSQPLGAR